MLKGHTFQEVLSLNIVKEILGSELLEDRFESICAVVTALAPHDPEDQLCGAILLPFQVKDEVFLLKYMYAGAGGQVIIYSFDLKQLFSVQVSDAIIEEVSDSLWYMLEQSLWFYGDPITLF